MSKITRLVQAQSNDDGLFGLFDDVVERLFPGTNARRKNAERAQAKAHAAVDAKRKAHAKWVKTGFSPAMNAFEKGCAPPKPVQ